MGIHYFRRYRMEINFQKVALPEAKLPEGYRWVSWDQKDLDRHSIVKHESFRHEIDSAVFPCLGDFVGCKKLMFEISKQKNFLPGATWMIAFAPTEEFTNGFTPADCATIQGLQKNRSLGAIQNVGVTPEHRGFGLGRALMLKSLEGFRAARLKKVYLEVTADNEPAVKLYESLGFEITRTMYKAVETVETEEVTA